MESLTWNFHHGITQVSSIPPSCNGDIPKFPGNDSGPIKLNHRYFSGFGGNLKNKEERNNLLD